MEPRLVIPVSVGSPNAVTVTEQRTLPEHGAPGPDRAMCYRLAAATGLRANELRSLVHDSFDLDTTVPTVPVEAGYSKRRKRDTLPIPEAILPGLRECLAEKEAGIPVFSGIWQAGRA